MVVDLPKFQQFTLPMLRVVAARGEPMQIAITEMSDIEHFVSPAEAADLNAGS